MFKVKRNVRRIQKAIDELIKICDDGKGNYEIRIILDKLNRLETEFDTEE